MSAEYSYCWLSQLSDLRGQIGSLRAGFASMSIAVD